MSYKITVQSTFNPADVVAVESADILAGVAQACDILGILDSNVFTLRATPSGTLTLASSVPSLTATLTTIN